MKRPLSLLISILIIWAIALIGFYSLFHQNQPAVANAQSSVIQLLPNHNLTPGAINPDITDKTVSKTICNKGHWSTSSIRPPVSYTNKLKAQQIKQYGYKDTELADFEEDHLIPLTLGGNPTDPKNLWPQSYKTTPNAREKDKVEIWLNKQVCDGDMSLKEAQTAIATNWVKTYQYMQSQKGGRSLGASIFELDQDDN